MKSEIGSRSTSFNSRARPSFLEEPVLDITFSKESEGEEEEEDCHNELPVYPDGDDDYYDDYLHAQDAMGSVTAMLDLTLEAVKPKPKSRTLVNSVMNFDYSMGSEEPGCSTSADKAIPILPSDVSEDNIHPAEKIIWDEKEEVDSKEINNQECLNLGEITSEADNYVDAANTLDSESETEPEVQMKRELTAPLTKPTPLDVDNSTKSHVSLVENDRPRDGHQESYIQDPLCAFSHAFSDTMKLEESESSNQPVTVWTNGGLLGLQPSKPPDFGVNDTQCENSHPTTPITPPMSSQTYGQQHGEEFASGTVDQEKRPLLRRKQMLEYDRSTWQETSPPLEHMKMSSYPMNGPDVSKLKLKFPGNHVHESVEELMFPSFQLLPGSTIPVNGSCSDSDDDTFCQSFPYSSEDSCSQHSDSNSELWTQEETRGCQPGFLDLSSDHVQENLAEGQQNEAFQFSEPLDLPNLESSVANSLSDQPVDSALTSSTVNLPTPPPLPPSGWKVERPGDDKSPSDEQVPKSDYKSMVSIYFSFLVVF